MADEQEIIVRPPSHPVTTTLLVVAALGTLGCIAFVWAELFTEYLPSRPPGAPMPAGLEKHDPVLHAKAESTAHDHYKEDYPSDDVLADVEKALNLSSTIGEIPAGIAGAAPIGGGGGAPPPVEAPSPAPSDQGGGGDGDSGGGGGGEEEAPSEDEGE